MLIHIIFTETEITLSKLEYESFREIQNDFCDYKASLGPWTETEVIDYLNFEYPDLTPKACVQVQKLKSSGHNEIALSTNRHKPNKRINTRYAR